MNRTALNDVTAESLAEGKLGRFVWLTGRNFSGRTAILQKACERHATRPGVAISIPPEVHNALSGLVPHVREEILLHAGRYKQTDQFWSLAEQWDLLRFSERDPFTLSGGEQSMLVVLCKLALNPELLNLDGALEQLDPDNLCKILRLFAAGQVLSGLPQVIFTHNGHLPSCGVESIPQISSAMFPDTDRREPPPLLDDPSFNPSRIPNPVTIHLTNLGFRYPGGATVFHKLNLKLEPGQIYRLAGANGSGKSTFARLLTGILRPTHGGIMVNNEQFDSYSRPGTLARLHFQSPDSQLFETTVRDELHFLPAGQAQAACQFAGLGSFLDQHPFDLPFVMRKRLALTLILHTSAPWLIFDEPTVGQDEDARAAIGHALRKLAKADHGVILISHNAEFAQSVSDKEINLPKLTNV